MLEQGYKISSTLYQDNQSAMILQKKGRSALGKRSRASDVRFFVIKASVEKNDLKIEHCPTDLMIGDFFTKPLQGAKFQYFSNLVLGGRK